MANESELAPLQRWIAATGALAEVASDKIDPVGVREGEYGAEDRSIVALAAVEAGEVLVTLRPGAFLSGSTWLARVDDKTLEQTVKTAQLSATALTALALLYEAGAGKASSFAGYIEQLPRYIPLPLSWSKESRELLKHTTSSPLIDAELVENVYRRHIAPLAETFPLAWPEQVTSFDKFRWAYSVVSSRAFTIGEGHEPTLLPVIDMANHDVDSPAAHIVKTDGGEFQLVADRDIAVSEGVTISYGELSNAQLLCRYGFVLPTATPSDSILITSAELSSTYKAYLHSATVADDDDDEADDDNDDDDDEVVEAAGSGKSAKRRKVFDTRPEAATDDALFFLLHGDPTREFGLGDALLSYVLAAQLPPDELYEVLTILLRKRDKQYCDTLAAAEAHGDEIAAAAVTRLCQHERHVCRRILLGLVTLEEESSSEEEDQDVDDE